MNSKFVPDLSDFRLAVVLLFALLVGCGGGGGDSGGGGGNPGGGTGNTGPGLGPILATIEMYEPMNGQSATATAFVTIQNPDWTAWITNAVVQINGKTIPYNTVRAAYFADVDVVPGQPVHLSVSGNGGSYSASRLIPATYPAVSSPANGTIWALGQSHLIQWTSAAPSGDLSRYLLVALGRSGARWPASNFQELTVANTQFNLPANAIQQAGIYDLAVGLTDVFDLIDGPVNSRLTIRMFGVREVDMRAVPAAIEITDNPAWGTAAVAVGQSRQLHAIVRYSCCDEAPLPAEAQWTSSNNGIVTVSASGLITGQADGNAVVTTEYLGRSTSIDVRVFESTPSPAPPLSGSVTLQVDYAHSGTATVGGDGPVVPLSGKWSRTFEGLVSYPVVADGRVFVSIGAFGAAGAMSSLYGLDATDGSVLWGPVLTSDNSRLAPIAYDQGRLFVINRDSSMRALDPATGSEIWSVTLPIFSLSAPPMAANGLVYGAGGPIFAMDALNGSRIWTASNDGQGSGSSPTLSPDGLFVAGCTRLDKFGPVSGEYLWHVGEACPGAGSRTSVYANGRVFVRDMFGPPGPLNGIFDASSGALLGHFEASTLPAATANRAYYLFNGTLTATNVATGNPDWSFTGDGGLVSMPLVIDSFVFIGSTTGMVYMLKADTGEIVWNETTGEALSQPGDGSLLVTPTGLGVGASRLFVPAGNSLTSWKLLP